MKTVILVVSLLLGLASPAYETDQYTVPPEPLADIGEDLSRFVYDRLQLGVREINRDLQELPSKIKQLEISLSQYPAMTAYDPDPQSPMRQNYQREQSQWIKLKERLAALQTELGVVSALQDTYSGTVTWNEQRDGVFGVGLSYVQYPQGRKNGRLVLYSQNQFNTIYSYSGFHRLISPSYFVFASTLNAYGVQMGVDKFGHFLNQGFEYFEKYRGLIKDQVPSARAMEETIKWGVETEDGLFGMLVDGVYSNGDLAANFAGFMFYSNFFHDLKLEGESYPRLFDREENGLIRWNASELNAPESLLKRFITAHLDESLNPSVLEAPQRGIVRSAIRNRCQSWVRYNHVNSAEQLKKWTDSLALWKGYAYGHRSENAIRLDEVCADVLSGEANR